MNQTQPVKVWTLFQCFSDGDGYIRFDLLDIFTSQEKALAKGAELGKNLVMTNYVLSAHKDMTAANNYTCIGFRADCISGQDQWNLGDMGGYLVEPHTLK
jgi:hypothetical protein